MNLKKRKYLDLACPYTLVFYIVLEAIIIDVPLPNMTYILTLLIHLKASSGFNPFSMFPK